jgi:antitoxin (DNA-binding transcriptional repressor) of toxin-antitoxin stability system
MRLGLREANQRFSKAIRAVRAGKEVVLTERPIAVIKGRSSTSSIRPADGSVRRRPAAI